MEGCCIFKMKGPEPQWTWEEYEEKQGVEKQEEEVLLNPAACSICSNQRERER